MRKRREGKGRREDREGNGLKKCSSFYANQISFLIILTMKPETTRKHIFCFKDFKTRLHRSRNVNESEVNSPRPLLQGGSKGREEVGGEVMERDPRCICLQIPLIPTSVIS